MCVSSIKRLPGDASKSGQPKGIVTSHSALLQILHPSQTCQLKSVPIAKLRENISAFFCSQLQIGEYLKRSDPAGSPIEGEEKLIRYTKRCLRRFFLDSMTGISCPDMA
jgi:hypothetical protein